MPCPGILEYVHNIGMLVVTQDGSRTAASPAASLQPRNRPARIDNTCRRTHSTQACSSEATHNPRGVKNHIKYQIRHTTSETTPNPSGGKHCTKLQIRQTTGEATPNPSGVIYYPKHKIRQTTGGATPNPSSFKHYTTHWFRQTTRAALSKRHLFIVIVLYTLLQHDPKATTIYTSSSPPARSPQGTPPPNQP